MKVRVLISGKVQGVFFRAYTKEKADELGLVGWVRNTKDGRVEAVFEGAKEKVEAMIKWCRKGPPGSKVKKVEISRDEVDKVYSPSLKASAYTKVSADKSVDKEKVKKACPTQNGGVSEEQLNKFEMRY